MLTYFLDIGNNTLDEEFFDVGDVKEVEVVVDGKWYADPVCECLGRRILLYYQGLVESITMYSEQLHYQIVNN